ncbi:hypothetical protein [Novosphingobium lentum]|uniref:hypothetical protein n=1 Tax=Novosphingobium lentum TaxID=145287 RepID=UPI00082F5EE2|nr:hypothetical protein [Novosphingobium lentum]
MTRILLALLALITGLTMPEIAFATSRTEVADSIATPTAAPTSARQQNCVGRGGVVPRRPVTVQRKTVWLPVPALIQTCGFLFGDRARE